MVFLQDAEPFNGKRKRMDSFSRHNYSTLVKGSFVSLLNEKTYKEVREMGQDE